MLTCSLRNRENQNSEGTNLSLRRIDHYTILISHLKLGLGNQSRVTNMTAHALINVSTLIRSSFLLRLTFSTTI